MKTLKAIVEKILLGAILYVLIAAIIVLFFILIIGDFISAIPIAFVVILIIWSLRLFIVKTRITFMNMFAKLILLVAVVTSTSIECMSTYPALSFSTRSLLGTFYPVYVFVVFAALLFYVVEAIFKWKQEAQQKTEPPEKPPTSSLPT